jgi:hypothetical protein
VIYRIKAWKHRPAWELKMLGKRNTSVPDLSAKAIIEEKKNSGAPPGWREVKSFNDGFQMFLAQNPKERQLRWKERTRWGAFVRELVWP